MTNKEEEQTPRNYHLHFCWTVCIWFSKRVRESDQFYFLPNWDQQVFQHTTWVRLKILRETYFEVNGRVIIIGCCVHFPYCCLWTKLKKQRKTAPRPGLLSNLLLTFQGTNVWLHTVGQWAHVLSNRGHMLLSSLEQIGQVLVDLSQWWHVLSQSALQVTFQLLHLASECLDNQHIEHKGSGLVRRRINDNRHNCRGQNAHAMKSAEILYSPSLLTWWNEDNSLRLASSTALRRSSFACSPSTSFTDAVTAPNSSSPSVTSFSPVAWCCS